MSGGHSADRVARIAATVLVVATGLAVLSLGFYRVLRPRIDHADPDRTRYPLRGIDISAHNGLVDFRKAAADSIAFVYMKATEGDGFADVAFDDNYFRARQAGLLVGAYHYFRFDCDGWRQGVNFLRAVGGKHMELPLAIDVEEWGNAPSGNTGDIILQLHAMVDYLKSHGHRVVLYTNKGSHRRFVRGHFDDLPLWICSFTDPPISRADWVLWQHSHSGRVDGVPGPVDLNTFCGDSVGFAHWIGEKN